MNIDTERLIKGLRAKDDLAIQKACWILKVVDTMLGEVKDETRDYNEIKEEKHYEQK